MSTQAEDRLRDYFESSASVAGLRSVHGALVDLAQSGASGTRHPAAPEERWWDARDRDGRQVDGPSRARIVRRDAETHRTLRALTAEQRDVLLAFYGSPPWPGQAPDTRDGDVGADEHLRRQQWSRQPPPEVRKALGAELGRVALLTAELAHEADTRGVPPARLLTAICQADGASLKPIATAARAAHLAALAAFCKLLGLELPEQERRTRKRERRAYAWHVAAVPRGFV